MIRADLLFDTEEAAGHAVEEDGKVVGLVDVAASAARLAVRHECGRVFEVLETFGTLHAGYTVVTEDVVVEIAGGEEVLPVVLLARKEFYIELRTYSQTNGQ
jgi:hypothetical protein